MGQVLIGITGWTEPTLVKDGTFYPKKTMSAEERLRFYAEQFPLVEVDSTYYAPPSERNAALWIERTPAHFTFNVKAYALLTNHPTKPDSLYRFTTQRRRCWRDADHGTGFQPRQIEASRESSFPFISPELEPIPQVLEITAMTRSSSG